MNAAAFDNPIYDDGSDDKNGESGYAEFEAAEPAGYLDMEGRCDPPSFASAFVNHSNWFQLHLREIVLVVGSSWFCACTGAADDDLSDIGDDDTGAADDDLGDSGDDVIEAASQPEFGGFDDEEY
jgi:hypothetical protein